MKKRLVSLILALVMALALAVPVQAAETAAKVSVTAGVNLTQPEQKIYKALETAIIEVAEGNRTSTEVTISFGEKELGWTAQELGLSEINYYDIFDPINKKIGDIMDRIYTCLELNYPFEMFWANNYWNWTWQHEHIDSEVWLTEFTCSYDVSLDYRGDSKITVNPAKIVQANSVRDTAKSIVQANEGKSDYEKLVAYKDAICARNSYNYDAFNLSKKDKDPYGEDHTYGNPWQLIYVFDENPSTNVLCEGYAKAFKYLCDLSDFDGDITCYLAEGHVSGEAHMWNVVWIDGAFYTADITYLDTGAPDSLFLAGASGNGRKYTVSADRERYTYIYREDQEDLFTDGYLPLSPTAYSPEQNGKPEPKPEPIPTFTDTPSWCAKEAQWAVQEGITNGAGSDTIFAPATQCTHDQILTFLWRAEGKPAAAQAPVTAASYYQDAVNWAYEKGFIDDSFQPTAPCTRAQAVSYIWQARNKPQAAKTASFTDVATDAPYAAAVNWAVEKEVTNGYGSDDTFAPDHPCGRGEIVVFLYRAYN